MGGMRPPSSSPILSLLGPLSTLHSRPASERHPPAGAGAAGQGQCFGHYRSQLSLFCRYNAYWDSCKQWDKWVRKISSIFWVWYIASQPTHWCKRNEFPQVKLRALLYVILRRCFRLIVKNVNCIEMVTAARSEDNCIKSLHRNICIHGRRGRWRRRNGEV